MEIHLKVHDPQVVFHYLQHATRTQHLATY